MTNNGAIPRNQLVEIYPGVLLERMTARAYRHAAIAFAKQSKTLRPAGRAAGYRDLAIQGILREVKMHGTPAQKAYWQLDSTSKVLPAYPGYSTHGFGTTIDVLIDGRSLNESERVIMAKYGFSWPFLNADRNHFLHVGLAGTTAITRAELIKWGVFVQPLKK